MVRGGARATGRGGDGVGTHTMANNNSGGGGGGGVLVVVTQCLLVPTGTHHSYTTHTVLRGEGRGHWG